MAVPESKDEKFLIGMVKELSSVTNQLRNLQVAKDLAEERFEKEKPNIFKALNDAFQKMKVDSYVVLKSKPAKYATRKLQCDTWKLTKIESLSFGYSAKEELIILVKVACEDPFQFNLVPEDFETNPETEFIIFPFSFVNDDLEMAKSFIQAMNGNELPVLILEQ